MKKGTLKEMVFEEPRPAPAIQVFRGNDSERDRTGMWPLEARCQNYGLPFGAHYVCGGACPSESQEAA